MEVGSSSKYGKGARLFLPSSDHANFLTTSMENPTYEAKEFHSIVLRFFHGYEKTKPAGCVWKW